METPCRESFAPVPAQPLSGHKVFANISKLYDIPQVVPVYFYAAQIQ